MKVKIDFNKSKYHMTPESILESTCRIKSKPALQKHHLLTAAFTLNARNRGYTLSCSTAAPHSTAIGQQKLHGGGFPSRRESGCAELPQHQQRAAACTACTFFQVKNKLRRCDSTPYT